MNATSSGCGGAVWAVAIWRRTESVSGVCAREWQAESVSAWRPSIGLCAVGLVSVSDCVCYVCPVIALVCGLYPRPCLSSGRVAYLSSDRAACLSSGRASFLQICLSSCPLIDRAVCLLNGFYGDPAICRVSSPVSRLEVSYTALGIQLARVCSRLPLAKHPLACGRLSGLWASSPVICFLTGGVT